MRLHRRSVVWISIAAALAAAGCSGGGGGGGDGGSNATPGRIDEADVSDMAGIASAASGLLDVAGFATNVLPGATTVGFLGAPNPEVVDCTDGGTITITLTDMAPMDELSTGDAFDVVFADCSEGTTNINGSFGFTVDQLSEMKSLVSVGLTFTIGQLTVVDSGVTVTQDGTFSESIDIDTGSGDFGYLLTGSFSASYNEGGNTLTFDLTGLDVGLDYMADMEVQAVRLNFTYDTNIGSDTDYSVTTLADFVSYGLDSNPTEGLLAIATSLDTLYMSAQPDGVNVLLELDQDSNGSTDYENATIDYSETIPWDEL